MQNGKSTAAGSPPGSRPRSDEPRSVKSAERVLDLIERIGEHDQGMSFAQIVSDLGIPKSSLHALLDVLEKRDYVHLDPETRRYTLGIKVWAAGQAFRQRTSTVELARPVMREIVDKVNETAQLASLAGRENVYLDKVDSSHALRLQSEIGTRLPAHATGLGKVLLAQLPDDEVTARFGNADLPVHSPTTLPSVAALTEELARIRERGFAIDNEEYSPGVFCLAVPIHEASGPAGTALSVSVPLSRATTDALATILAELARGSIAISAQRGRRQPDAKLAALASPAAAKRAIKHLVTSGSYAIRFVSTTTTAG